MTFSKILLGFTGIVFAGYGVWCAVDPGVVAGYSGLSYPTRSAVVEARAMYGGVQLGFGAFLLYGAMRSSARVHTLVATLLVVGGLASCRAIGLALAGPDDYNVAAVLYETTTTLLFAVAWAREQRADAALGA